MKTKKRYLRVIAAGLSMLLFLSGCSTDTQQAAASGAPSGSSAPAETSAETEAAGGTQTDEKVVIGVAQCHLNTPSRVNLRKEMEDAIQEKGLNLEIILTDGQNNSAKQTSDVEDLIQRGVDLMILVPVQAEPLAPVAKKVLDAGIPLILIDRTISTDDYTAYTGGDNRMIGEIAADFLAEKIGGKGKLAIIQGTLGTSATNERQEGFLTKMESEYPDIEIISDLSADYKRDQAMKVMEDLLQANEELDAVFCHSDNMALGAIQAIEAAGREDEIAVIGADGQKEIFDKIKENDLLASIIYPMGGAEAIALAEQILAGETVEKVNLIPVTLVRENNVDELYDQGF